MNQKVKRPIGYWIKQADKLLTDGINNIQAANGLSRTDWQILNVIKSSPNKSVALKEITDIIHPFANQTDTSQILNELLKRELISQTNPIGYQLTHEGEKLFENSLKAQKEFRKSVMEGITAAEYETTITVLQRLVRNLDSI